jgi:hypothetical protein
LPTDSAIETLEGPGGVMLHLVPALPPALPAVTARDIEQAWEATQPATAAPPRAFRFAGATPLELTLADPDARAWVAAVERTFGLSTLHGMSVCLRLLALIALMADAGWARAWFKLARDGAVIRPELLRAAAYAPLNEAAGFDETALQALLPCSSARV